MSFEKVRPTYAWRETVDDIVARHTNDLGYEVEDEVVVLTAFIMMRCNPAELDEFVRLFAQYDREERKPNVI
jgi:hypothetical protein